MFSFTFLSLLISKMNFNYLIALLTTSTVLLSIQAKVSIEVGFIPVSISLTLTPFA